MAIELDKAARPIEPQTTVESEANPLEHSAFTDRTSVETNLTGANPSVAAAVEEGLQPPPPVPGTSLAQTGAGDIFEIEINPDAPFSQPGTVRSLTSHSLDGYYASALTVTEAFTPVWEELVQGLSADPFTDSRVDQLPFPPPGPLSLAFNKGATENYGG